MTSVRRCLSTSRASVPPGSGSQSWHTGPMSPREAHTKRVSQRDSSGTGACVSRGRSGGWQGRGRLQPHHQAAGRAQGRSREAVGRLVPSRSPGPSPRRHPGPRRAGPVCAPATGLAQGLSAFCCLFLAIVFGGDKPLLHQLRGTRAAPHTWASRHWGAAWASQVAFAPLSPPLAGWWWPSSARPVACRRLPGRSSGRSAAALGTPTCVRGLPVAWTQGGGAPCGEQPRQEASRPIGPPCVADTMCGLCVLPSPLCSASSAANAGTRCPGVVPGVPASPRGCTSCFTWPGTQRPPLAAAFPSQAGDRL